MEYLAGALVTLITVYVAIRMSANTLKNSRSLNLNRSQSRIHEITKNSIAERWKRKPSQTGNHDQEKFMRVVFMDDLVYWIEDNAVYSADYEDGHILESTKKVVDTTTMDKVQLDKMIFIVDKLTEGLTDDSGNSRN